MVYGASRMSANLIATLFNNYSDILDWTDLLLLIKGPGQAGLIDYERIWVQVENS